MNRVGGKAFSHLESVKTYANNYTTSSSVALPDIFNLDLLSSRLIIIIATAYL